MEIGVFSILPDADADPAVVARHAERLGFASYWVPDHLVLPVVYSTRYPGNPGDGADPDYLWQMPDPIVALMRAATATERILVGTGVLLVPERNPLHLAKEIASLDSFSGGRFWFGIGAGWNREESQILGGDFEHRWTQVREAIAVMKACWTQDESEYHGAYYDFPPVRCFPKPAQKPYPPILLPSIMFGGQWAKRVFHRIVAWGDGWLPAVQEIGQLVDGRNQLDALAKEAGRDPRSIRIVALGAQGQYRTRKEIGALERAGIDHATIWLGERETAGILKELDDLASDIL
jgi:probable F420-dependent oxidoreductase